MRRNSLRSIVAMLVAGVAIFTQISCRENTLIDAKVAPNLNNMSVYSIPDTFTIYAKTVYDDSVITSISITGFPIYHALGTIGGSGADPFFGKTNAGIYMQIIPQNTNPTVFKSGYTIDSTILILPYGGYYYGDPSGPDQSVTVYPLSDTMATSVAYHAYNQKAYNIARPYGSATISMTHLTDSIFMYGRNRGPLLRIKLNSDFQTDLKNASQDSAKDYPTFLRNFRGLYIRSSDTNQNGGTLPYYELDGADTFAQANVLVFYHTTSIDTPQVFQYPFSMSYCGHFNNIKHNYTGAPVLNYFSSTERSTRSDSIILMQNQPGAAFDIRIPFLGNLKSSIPKFVINKAELIITQVNTNTSSIFTPPAKIYAMTIDDNLNRFDLADRHPSLSISPLAFLNGYAESVTIDGHATTQYTLNIPREIINDILLQRELHLRINGTQDYPGAHRLIAGGRTNTDPRYRIKLNIVYSKQN